MLKTFYFYKIYISSFDIETQTKSLKTVENIEKAIATIIEHNKIKSKYHYGIGSGVTEGVRWVRSP